MRPKNFHRQLVESLGREIASGKLRPGIRLPTEAGLSEQFGVSRVTIREAVKSLAAKGMVSVGPSTGTHVLPRENWSLLDPDVLDWLSSTEFGMDFVQELVDLRRIIEPAAARLASQRATAEDLSAIGAAFLRMEEAVANRDEHAAADLAFHAAILKASHNNFLWQMNGALSRVLSFSFSLSSRHPLRGRISLEMHRDVLMAIQRRDGQAAAKAIEALIEDAGGRIEAEMQARAIVE